MTFALSLERISKCYEGGLAEERPAYATLRESLTNLAAGLWRRRRAAPPEPFWALRDVSFDVAPGEVVGIIGRNGAGKSTLLKVLSRITAPTAGRARLRGRVGSLLEVGTGFHPELTGRENIYLNGAILGMSRREIAARFDAIVAFAEVERFLDLPVKRYSSGMYTRLGFAVAAHLEPEILVIDEVLAVGDAEFQKKCLSKMGDVARQGRTVLFVSHNMGAVQTICERVVLLSHGQVQRIGPAREVVAEYLKVSDALCALPLTERTDRRGSGRFRFAALTFCDGAGNVRPFALTGEDLELRIRLQTPSASGPMPVPLDVSVGMFDAQGHKLTEVASFFTGSSPTTYEGAAELVCRVPRLPLLAGQYRLDLWCGTSSETQDYLQDAAVLRVEPGNYFGTVSDVRLPVVEKHGSIMIPQSWLPTEATRT
jgi:lipopolysaccharide transport system ATP-binding protein